MKAFAGVRNFKQPKTSLVLGKRECKIGSSTIERLAIKLVTRNLFMHGYDFALVDETSVFETLSDLLSEVSYKVNPAEMVRVQRICIPVSYDRYDTPLAPSPCHIFKLNALGRKVTPSVNSKDSDMKSL
ncbi:hypothetical protein P5673_017600 [Acropora cervicornis]|uniref:Uncharacterized protein n=1 Tax=Acropora cervicornis TaxID=6130 RepID=A0AAD9V438_ACRCE|nr:hypothetical protein P5673_017600 [Acropora cervicornis]